MKDRVLSEPMIVILTVATLVVLLATRDIAMSDMVSAMLIGFFVCIFGVFTLFIWRESPADERELAFSLDASKHAYLAGAGVISIGIVVQAINHDLDIWLPFALLIMVITKTLSLYITRKRQE